MWWVPFRIAVAVSLCNFDIGMIYLLEKDVIQKYTNGLIQAFLSLLKSSTVSIVIYPSQHYLLNVNNRNTSSRCEICSKLSIKTPGVVLVSLLLTWTYFTPWSNVSIVNFEHIIAIWDKYLLSKKLFRVSWFASNWSIFNILSK